MQKLKLLKSKKNTMIVALIVFYIAIMLYTIYYAISFSDRLIYDFNVLNINDYHGDVKWTFNLLILLVVLALGSGLVALMVVYRLDSAQIIYVEKTDDKQKSAADQENSTSTFNLNLDKILTGSDKKGASIQLMNAICEATEAVQGLLYLENKNQYNLSGGFALYDLKDRKQTVEAGDGLTGQAIAEKKALYIEDVKEGYLTIASGLGKSDPSFIGIFPIIDENNVVGVMEIAKFKPFDSANRKYIEEITISWGQFLSEKKAPTNEKKVNKNKDQ